MAKPKKENEFQSFSIDGYKIYVHNRIVEDNKELKIKLASFFGLKHLKAEAKKRPILLNEFSQ